jgi:NAD+ diphosphatase
VGVVTHVHERLTGGGYDRMAARRGDTDWLSERWADPVSRVLVVAGTRIRPADGAVPWVAPDQAPPGARLLLGVREEVAHFAVITDPDPSQEGWVPLRGLLSVLTADEAPLVLHAIGLAEWLRATRFCARCGQPLAPVKEGHELVCANGHTTFPRTDPAVIMLITDGEPGSPEERCLLGRQPVWPQGRFSTLAGFCEPGESLEDAVRREVAEETGVVVGEVTYFGNQPWPLPASLMLGFTGRAVSAEIVCDLDEIEDARWFTRAQLRAGAESGSLVLPGGVSISRSLVEAWYGAALPGSW